MDIKTLKNISKAITLAMLINLIILPIIIYGFIIKEPFAVVVTIMSLSALYLINLYRTFGNVLLALLSITISQLFRIIDLHKNERVAFTVMLFFMFLLVLLREQCAYFIHKKKRQAELEAMVKTGHAEGYCNHPDGLHSRAKDYTSHTNVYSHSSGESVPYKKMFPSDVKITHVKENSENETSN